jgi:hypothetical protein
MMANGLAAGLGIRSGDRENEKGNYRNNKNGGHSAEYSTLKRNGFRPRDCQPLFDSPLQ